MRFSVAGGAQNRWVIFYSRGQPKSTLATLKCRVAKHRIPYLIRLPVAKASPVM